MRDSYDPLLQKYRKTAYNIHPLLFNRWSPRSMSGEKMTEEELLPLFEAASFAPSSYNAQPWKFVYAKRDDADWNQFFSLLVEFNQNWVKNAAALILVISRETFEHNNKPSVTHSFDAGAAWMSLALEGTYRGYVVHGMQGFDYQKAKELLRIPEPYAVEAMIAIGKPAQKSALSNELQKIEVPSTRKPLQEIIHLGAF